MNKFVSIATLIATLAVAPAAFAGGGGGCHFHGSKHAAEATVLPLHYLKGESKEARQSYEKCLAQDVRLDKAEQQLGFTPKFSNRDALLRNFEWYIAHRDQFAEASGISHRVPWKQGAIGVLKRFF